MPTAAKLVGSFIFAVVGYIAAALYIPLLPAETQVGWFRELTALLGGFCGWVVIGSLVSNGKLHRKTYRAAVESGIRTSLTILFWALLLFSIKEMIHLSTKMFYDGPMEAVLAVFDLMLQHAKLLLEPTVPGFLIVGGIFGGLLTEWSGRRWR